jgi:hypothetical protein
MQTARKVVTEYLPQEGVSRQVGTVGKRYRLLGDAVLLLITGREIDL